MLALSVVVAAPSDGVTPFIWSGHFCNFSGTKHTPLPLSLCLLTVIAVDRERDPAIQLRLLECTWCALPSRASVDKPTRAGVGKVCQLFTYSTWRWLWL